MNSILKSILFWLLAIILATGVAIYQRMTGPTYPISGKVQLGDELVSYKLIRTWGEESDAKLVIPVKQQNVSGEFSWKRYKSHDEWESVGLERTGEGLVTWIPRQPPAGKVMYEVSLFYGNSEYVLTQEPAIIRFKGVVPDWVTILHVIFIFLAFILSIRTGLEALAKGRYTFGYTVFTVIFLVLGGLVFGPIMQKYAFGAYWTGWPFGHDLTDNKTAVAAIFWFIALFSQIRNRATKRWAAIASLVLLLVYLIPHSMMGSELDHTKDAPQTTESAE
ncbi:MAG: hypothetical protein R6V49_11205 [Bacteroidales bacterium]